MLNYQRVNGGFLIALITRRVSLKKLSLRLSTCIQMVCVCIHKQDVVYYCANGHIICEVFKSESAFCRRYMVEDSLAVSRSLPFLRTTNPTGSVQELFLSHVIFASIISSIVFHIVFHIFHILYQLYQHHLSTLSRGSHHLQISSSPISSSKNETRATTHPWPMDHQGAMCTRHGAHKGEAEGFRVVRIQGVALRF